MKLLPTISLQKTLTLSIVMQSAAVSAVENAFPVSPVVDISSFVTMFFGLVAVLVLIFVVAWLTRKLKLLQHISTGHQIKNLATLSLTNREKVSLIEVGGKQLLIGIAPGRVNQLHVFDEMIDIANQHNEDKSDSLFSRHFKNALGGSADRSIPS